MSHIIHGDSLDKLKTLDDNSVDSVITDPPYGYSFMGKDWDKAVPSVEIWKECLRVLKPGAFCMVMSAPRSDVQNAMISRLMEAGFRLDFTPIYWTYASGFPKAGNVGKLVDKRLGAEREVVGPHPYANRGTAQSVQATNMSGSPEREQNLTAASSPEARALDGSYTGFQPKPAVEVVIVAMKPLSEKTYVDQALTNRKGISWLDDGRIPGEERTTSFMSANSTEAFNRDDNWQPKQGSTTVTGRFPANLLVSDEALNGHSKYFDLDKWYEGRQNVNVPRGNQSNREVAEGQSEGEEEGQRTLPEGFETASNSFDTLPFLAVPKASKSEKNAGLEHLPPMPSTKQFNEGMEGQVRSDGTVIKPPVQQSNHHPTVKPLKLMSYLITLTTREGDTVLDPFVGSGTTAVAAHQLGRNSIGIEREEEYAEIARARLSHVTLDIPQLPAEKSEAAVPPTTITQVTQASLFDANL